MSDMWLLQLRESINDKLNDIAALFISPKITLLVRAPQLKDGDLVMTNDNLDEAIAAIQALWNREKDLAGLATEPGSPITGLYKPSQDGA